MLIYTRFAKMCEIFFIFSFSTRYNANLLRGCVSPHTVILTYPFYINHLQNEAWTNRVCVFNSYLRRALWFLTAKSCESNYFITDADTSKILCYDCFYLFYFYRIGGMLPRMI